MTGSPEELRERVRALAEAGVKQIAFIRTPSEYEAFVREFSREIIARV